MLLPGAIWELKIHQNVFALARLHGVSPGPHWGSLHKILRNRLKLLTMYLQAEYRYLQHSKWAHDVSCTRIYCRQRHSHSVIEYLTWDCYAMFHICNVQCNELIHRTWMTGISLFDSRFWRILRQPWGEIIIHQAGLLYCSANRR